MHDSRWAKKISYFSPGQIQQDGQMHENKRNRGRPRVRWEDDLNNFAKYHGYGDWLAMGDVCINNWLSMTQQFVNFTLYHEFVT